ncbi:MAG: fumarate hydratase C-terminal domain-containing protein [Candidatus Coatesbacteria bacterium]|nr:fumarate hydratase C-terminal domain-containing protein [Candidatus Coatesbacteria bacterium]
MGEPKRIVTPLTEDAIASLRAGDECLVSGELIGARDQAHRLLFDMVQRGEKLPFDLSGAVIYYVGPTPARPGLPIGSAGPTTSARMDPFTPALLEKGLKGMIGKGQRSEEVKRAIMEHRAVYFAAPGGLGAYLASRIVSSAVIFAEELGPEAVRRLTVRDMPVIVVNDIHGGDAYLSGRRQYSHEDRIRAAPHYLNTGLPTGVSH